MQITPISPNIPMSDSSENTPNFSFIIIIIIMMD
ncbi:hypothetical protein CLIM01_14273 [Colletotrichum limetticola]|uniref:Uncharacterized protein n=1 Tax=Colletotrichum limetticola TaxID=1209924 RepID=A0ABQ9P9M0_9PEZI|nr:hypothetical protein CLIM01_14273 [Colletotrichum limetticola]